jgi:hypothetical protein
VFVLNGLSIYLYMDNKMSKELLISIALMTILFMDYCYLYLFSKLLLAREE